MSDTSNTTTTTMVSTATSAAGTKTNTMTLPDAIKAVEVAKEQINTCDQQNSIYKAALRNLTSSGNNSTDASTDANSITIEWTKVDTSKSVSSPISKLVLQLSSPVEEATLYLSSSTTTTTDSATKGGGSTSNKVVFTSVETGQATLSLTVDTTPTTTSDTAYMDVSKFTNELLDAALQQQQQASAAPTQPKSYETTLQIPILPMKSQDDITKASDKNEDPICTITLRIVYVPSKKDIRETLCEKIGKIATTKAIAREELRKASLLVHELTVAGGTKSSSMTKPAVKPGFLQKDGTSSSSTTDATSNGTSGTKLTEKLYKTLESYYTIVSGVIVPVMKNYVYFIAFTIVSHYYGHYLAIPPPV